MNLKLREEDSCCVVTCIYKYIFSLSKRKGFVVAIGFIGPIFSLSGRD